MQTPTNGTLAATVEAVTIEPAELGVKVLIAHRGNRLRVAFDPSRITREQVDGVLRMTVPGYAEHLRAVA